MMKAYMLTLCALALPASAAAADTTLNEINARLERLEAELKQSRIQLQDATRKIDAAEKERPAPKNAARAQERLQFVEQQTEQDLAQIKSKPSQPLIAQEKDREIKFGGYARSGILTSKGTTSTVGPL
jgi:sucrose porin